MSLPPLECLYLTEESLRELKNGNSTVSFPSPVPLLRFLYEFCWATVRGELPLQKCKALLDGVQFLDGDSEELSSTLADIITQMALDLTMPGEYRARLIKLAKWLVESALVPLRHFQERCEEEFLWEAEMIKIKAQDLKGKEVRVNTRLLYQQTKFNLLREESEGYAKLVTLLSRGSEDATSNPSTARIGIIKSLIGHFDLDPNRVFDIVLEFFELQPDNNVFLQLIPIFPKSHASHILGFKFQYYQRMEVNSPTPFGLYKLTALLVKEDFIDLDSIYAHLLPKDEEAFEHYNAVSAKRLDEANKIGKINLAAIGKDLMEEEKQGDVTVDLFTALDMETEAVAERASELDNNQTLGLLTGFLAVDDWRHAHVLFDRLSPLNPVAHTQICTALLRIIEKTISSAYEVVRRTHLQSFSLPSGAGADMMETSNTSTHSSFIDLPRELFQMLATVGPHLYRDTLLVQKVCRVLKGYYLCALELVSSSDGALNLEMVPGRPQNPRLHLKEARLRVEEALGSCLLPSLQLIPANPAIGQQVWEVLNLLPYEVRYRLYGEWEKDDERNPIILAAKQMAKLDTRRILKRLAKENLKQLGRMVAKLAHANPMTVLRTIVHQIEAYKDMINPVVDAFKYLTQLEYDVLEYVVIERLAQGGRDKLKDDGLNLSDWLQSLASFWGHLCKKYPSMELRGLFQYLVNQLKKGVGTELVLLEELVQQMANVQFTENLTEEQLDSMAGSETLRYQATSFGVTRNNKALIKSTNRLRDSLLPKDEPKLAVPLLLLIAQHRSLVVINADAPYIKMVSEQFDRCHETLLQYVEFLYSAVTPATSYALLIPRLDDLVHLYHLDAEVAFLIYRPVMRLFKCQGSSDVFWPLDGSDSAHSSIANTESDAEEPSKIVLDLGPSRMPIMWSDLLSSVKTMLPTKAWNSLSPELYVNFWGLTLYDLHVPRNRYEAEIGKQHAALKALEELSDNSSSAIVKRKKDKERIQEALDRLMNEHRQHEEHVASVRRRLSHEKEKWLSSCPDTLRINMEFLQRCIIPRCIFSMPDAVYCAMFVHTLHSLGTPYFNTVNHIDTLICKTLQPMICCCTEYEVGRLGRFLFETLKIAYHWKSDESIYERKCGNMPGFAVYYRYPNSERVPYGQFIKLLFKWSQKITRLLNQCLESTEYMEIRNALIMLTKVSSIFPVTRKSGIMLEKRVAKIKSDEREDLKVLATGVAAALAARKSSWVTDEEFGMGYLELKPAASLASKSGNSVSVQSGSALNPSHGDAAGGKSSAFAKPNSDSVSSARDQIPRTKSDGRLDKAENAPNVKSDPKTKGALLTNGAGAQPSIALATGQSGSSRSTENQKQLDDPSNKSEETANKSVARNSSESEVKASGKRSATAGSLTKTQKQDPGRDDVKSGKATGRNVITSTSDRDLPPHASEGRQGKDDVPDSQRSLRSAHSPRHDTSTNLKSSGGKVQKRTNPAEETDRLSKRRKGDVESKDLEGEAKISDSRSIDLDKMAADEQASHRTVDKTSDRAKDKGGERYDKEHREKSRGDDLVTDKSRDRSVERHGRERSVERGSDRHSDKAKDEKSKQRHADTSSERSHIDDRFQGLPPPPPLPSHGVPQSVNPAGRRDDDPDRRFGSTRHAQRLSPRHEEKERRRSEENLSVPQDDAKRRREDEPRDRKREERDGLPTKVDDRDRERANSSKEDIDAGAVAKRRKLKREHLPSGEPGEYSPVAPQPPLAINLSQSYDLRDRGDRKGPIIQRPGYLEDQGMRIHGKEAASKMARRDTDPMFDREWEDEKRQRAEAKRRHRK